MSRIQLSHVTHAECVTLHVAADIDSCTGTHSYVCHDPFTGGPWLIHTCGMTHAYVCHDSFIRVPCLNRMCAKTDLYVWYDSCSWTGVTNKSWSSCSSNPLQSITIHSYLCYNSFICMPLLMILTHAYVWHHWLSQREKSTQVSMRVKLPKDRHIDWHGNGGAGVDKRWCEHCSRQEWNALMRVKEREPISLILFIYLFVCHDSFIYVTCLVEPKRRSSKYGVAMNSRLLKIIGLFCRTSSLS